MKLLDRKIAVICGAGGGIGSSTARILSENGATTLLVGRKKIKGSHDAFVADLSDEKSVKKLSKLIKNKYGKIDLLVNSAGWLTAAKPIDKMSFGEYQKYLKLNLDISFLLFKYLLPLTKKSQDSHFINIASSAGLYGNALVPIYAAAKAGVINMSESVAKGLESGKVIVLCPGPTNTKMRAKLFGKKEAESKQSPDFIAETILKMITGKIKAANGDKFMAKDGNVQKLS